MGASRPFVVDAVESLTLLKSFLGVVIDRFWSIRLLTKVLSIQEILARACCRCSSRKRINL